MVNRIALGKDWQDGSGDVLSVTYHGEGNGTAQFSSSTNEGIDRGLSVSFTSNGILYAQRNVIQVGMREVFTPVDMGFTLADGGTFNVLKDELQQ